MPNSVVRSVSPTSKPLRQKHILLQSASRRQRSPARTPDRPAGARVSRRERPDTLLRVSRFRAVLVAVCATGSALLTAACAAGQLAATADEKPAVDGTLRRRRQDPDRGRRASQAPSGTSYAQRRVRAAAAYIVNNGETADKLVKVSSAVVHRRLGRRVDTVAARRSERCAQRGRRSRPTNGAPQTDRRRIGRRLRAAEPVPLRRRLARVARAARLPGLRARCSRGLRSRSRSPSPTPGRRR